MSTVVAKNLAVQNSAGTASTNISFDGTKLVSTALDNSITATANLYDLGVGQTWQDVTASRAAGVTYTNSTGKPIVVHILLGSGTSPPNITVGGVLIYGSGVGQTGQFMINTAVIPNGATYVVNARTQWLELR